MAAALASAVNSWVCELPPVSPAQPAGVFYGEAWSFFRLADWLVGAGRA